MVRAYLTMALFQSSESVSKRSRFSCWSQNTRHMRGDRHTSASPSPNWTALRNRESSLSKYRVHSSK
jgi:hypothetical protein